MVGSVVLNQDRALAAVTACQLLQKGEVGGGVEYTVGLVVEAAAPEFHGTQDLHVMAFPGDGDLGGMTDATPGRMQRRVLAEAGFVGKDQRPLPRLGFFLRLG